MSSDERENEKVGTTPTDSLLHLCFTGQFDEARQLFTHNTDATNLSQLRLRHHAKQKDIADLHLSTTHHLLIKSGPWDLLQSFVDLLTANPPPTGSPDHHDVFYGCQNEGCHSWNSPLHYAARHTTCPTSLNIISKASVLLHDDDECPPLQYFLESDRKRKSFDLLYNVLVRTAPINSLFVTENDGDYTVNFLRDKLKLAKAEGRSDELLNEIFESGDDIEIPSWLHYKLIDCSVDIVIAYRELILPQKDILEWTWDEFSGGKKLCLLT